MTIWHSLIIFQAVFGLYDKDNSGCLSAFELRQALNSAGYRLNNHILNILAHRYSTKNGMITFDDFMMCAVRLKAMIGELSHSALPEGCIMCGVCVCVCVCVCICVCGSETILYSTLYCRGKKWLVGWLVGCLF